MRVSLTTDCNKSCWYCFNEGQTYEIKTLEDIDGFKWFIKQMVINYSTQLVRFTGGEPLMHPAAIKMVHITKTAGVKKVGITTNGVLVEKHIDKLAEHGLDSCAVHLCHLDEQQKANLQLVTNQMTTLVNRFARTRFNVVLVKSNFLRVEELIGHIADRGIKIQILDLLRTDRIRKVKFEEEYCELNSLHKKLRRHDFKKTNENKNVKIFRRDRTIIKLVEHYANLGLQKSYCTRQLAYNPILLTPDFHLSYCTHFNKPTYSISDAVSNQDVLMLRDVIQRMKQDAVACTACSDRVVLEDLKY